MIAPRWLRTRTQAIGIDDVVTYLATAAGKEDVYGREVQLGSEEVFSYGEMLDAMADALGVRRRIKIPVPFLSPTLSSLWLGLVTPVDIGVARPLVEGLSTETIVKDGSGAALFPINPMSVSDALARALAEDEASSESEPAATGAPRSPAAVQRPG
jgi:uncharacterized protein YbjT (DUF2867 family)